MGATLALYGQVVNGERSLGQFDQDTTIKIVEEYDLKEAIRNPSI
jgi:hypothetical protein